MIVLKAYSVLDTLALEVSCYHPGEPESSHLLIRETTTGPTPDVAGALRRCAEVLELEASLRRAGRLPDDPACLQAL